MSRFRFVGVVLALLILFGLAVSWRAGTSTAFAAKKVVRVWDWNVHDKKYKQKAFKDFNKDHPDMEIQYTSQVGSLYNEVLNMAFTAGEPPDIFYPTENLTMMRLIENKWIIPLDDIVPRKSVLDAWKAGYPKEVGAFVDGGNVIDGKTYTFPLWGQTGGGRPLFYNIKLFREAGLVGDNGRISAPLTWSEFRDAARKVTTKGNRKFYGIAIGAKFPWVIGMYVDWGTAVPAGAIWANFDYRTGRWAYNHPATKKAFDLWLAMKKDGSILPGELGMDDEGAKRAFALDQAAMVIGGPWNPGNFLAYNPKVQFDVVLSPVPDDGVRRGYELVGAAAGGGWGYVVSAFTKHKDATWKVIEFLTSLEFHEGYVKNGLGISVFPEANRPENFDVPAMAKMAEWGRTQVRIASTLKQPESQKVFGELMEPVHPEVTDVYQGIWIGKATYEALDRVNEEKNKAFDRAIVLAQSKGMKIRYEDFVFPDWDQTQNYVMRKK